MRLCYWCGTWTTHVVTSCRTTHVHHKLQDNTRPSQAAGQHTSITSCRTTHVCHKLQDRQWRVRIMLLQHLEAQLTFRQWSSWLVDFQKKGAQQLVRDVSTEHVDELCYLGSVDLQLCKEQKESIQRLIIELQMHRMPSGPLPLGPIDRRVLGCTSPNNLTKLVTLSTILWRWITPITKRLEKKIQHLHAVKK